MSRTGQPDGTWATCSLYELADYTNGRATKPSEVTSDGTPVIKIAELRSGISERTNRVPSCQIQDRHWVGNGDLLFAWSGSVGIHLYRGPPAALNQHIFRVEAYDHVDQSFLHYLLLSQVTEFNALVENKKTTMGHVTVRDLKATEVMLPPLLEQRAIAHVLGTLDDKIELNRRTSETLEAMARALFKAWFVDFEPVRAKMDGRWRRGESLPGLPAEIYDLFPDRLADSELGPIPDGWSVIPVGDAVTVLGGTTPRTKEPIYWNGTHPFATPRDLSALQLPVLNATVRSLTNAGLARIPSGLLPPRTVLLSSRAPIGYLAIATIGIAVNQGIIAMVCDGPVRSPYALHWARSNMDAIESRASGTTFAEISKSSFRKISFLKPPKPVHDAWHSSAAKIYDRLEFIVRESRALALLRDTLLPKLLSGEVRVPEAVLDDAGL